MTSTMGATGWRKREGGFTLIELMVVVMIIAVLMAIAIPTFLSSRRRAQDSEAKSNVRNALTAAQVVFTDTQSYPAPATLASTLSAEEPSLTFVTTASTDPEQISVYTDSATTVVLSAQAESGKCFSVKNVNAAGGGTTEYEAASGTTCLAANAPPGSAPPA